MAVKNPKTSWLLTQSGRNFSMAVASATAISCIAARFVPNTFLINKYEELVSSYRETLPVPVTSTINERFSKVLDILQISERERRYFKPFTVFGFDIFSAGSSLSKWGAIIGIPESFNFTSRETADLKGIQVNNEPINWNQPEAEQLLNALILSENAQIFAIAREVEEKRSAKLILDSMYPPLVIFTMYGLGQYYNNKLNFYARPRSLRMIMYSILGLFGTGLYCLLKDFTQNHYDANLDKSLAEKDPLFISGGLEFYTKIIERNKALRTLLGKTGQDLYSVYGNENFFLRNERLPLNVRKLYFEKKLEELGTKPKDETDF